MNPNRLKSILQHQINNMNESEYAKRPGKDFSRSRKLPLNALVTTILHMEGRSIGNELLSSFPKAKDTPSVSAFVQQRNKLRPDALETLFRSFVSAVESVNTPRSYRGMRLLAVDGSIIHIPTDPSDDGSLCIGRTNDFPLPYNMLKLNAMYDLLQRIYVDETIDDYHNMNEHAAFVKMVDRSTIPNALVMADRGYESFNDMAHVTEKGWHFLIRIKDIKSRGIASSLPLPDTDSFDEHFDLDITRSQTNTVKKLLTDRSRYKFMPQNVTFDYLPVKDLKADTVKWYRLSFRIVRFPISEDTHELVITNLPSDDFPQSEIKRLYALRWGIETSFRSLKYTVGLLYFHSKKAEYIRHEIAARLIMYNFFEMITTQVIIESKDRKYDYRANFSAAVHICRLFIQGGISPPDIEAQIARSIVPVRPNRKRKREIILSSVISFTYRLS